MQIPSTGLGELTLMKLFKKLNWSLGPQATANFGLVFVVLIFNSVVVHRNTAALHTSQKSIDRTYDDLIRIQKLFSSLNDAEDHVRGYVITSDENYLNEAHQLTTSIPDQIELLRPSMSTNPSQLRRLDEMDKLVTGRLDHLQKMTVAHAAGGIEAASALLKRGQVQAEMSRIRELVEDIQSEENTQLSRRTAEQDHKLFIVLAANLIAVLIGTTITIVAWYLVEQELQKRRTAEAGADLERQNLWVTLTSIADGVIVVDSNARVKLANQVAQDLIGQPGDVLGRTISEIFPIINETTRQPIDNPVVQVLASRKITGLLEPSVLVRPDGSEIPIEQNAAPIRDAAGKTTGAVLVFRDCTERRRVEREMQDRELRFRRVFETPLIGMAVGTTRGQLLEANDVFLDLIGYGRSQLGHAALSWDGISPGQKSPLDDGVHQELREKGVCRPFERTYTRTDGTRVPVLISAARLMDDQDRIVVFVTDLSASKRAEAALHESEARFRILSECMPQKVWTSRPDGHFDYLNHMFLEYAGLPAETLTGSGWIDLIHPDDIEAYKTAWTQSLSTGDMFEFEHRVRKHSGEYRWHLARALPMYNPDSQIAIWVGTTTDIDDQKQAEEALREEHHRKDQFLALLAHELRNPLAPLSNAIQVFPAVQKDPVNSAALLGIMQRQVRQMTRLIDDLLDLARITTGRMRLRRERIVVDTVVSAAVEAVQPLINERAHRLTVLVPSEELWLDADSTRLSQILTNLLHNAAKYSDTHGDLTLAVERSDEELLFRVKDKGPGISKEMLTQIFDLFTQVELTLDRAHGGLGIGLTLVRTLVELHGGSVSASSEGLGHGSEFIVRLPLASPPPKGSMEQDAGPTESVAIPALKILVVDDVQASAKTLALMLQTLGQDVDVAFDGPSAISQASTTAYQIIFLDIAMPGMDGLEVARRLRVLPELESTTLVALTGFGQEEDRAHSFQAGFNEHLTKPTSLDLLKSVLQRTANAAAKNQPLTSSVTV